MARTAGHRGGLSARVVVVSGVTAAFFLLVAAFLVRRIADGAAPSRANVDSLLRKGKYEDALALVQSGRGDTKSVDAFVQEGRVWLALAWSRQNRERWSTYGTNERDWFDMPEADNAENALNRAIKLDSRCVDALYYRGMLYTEKGWYSAAESDFYSVLRLAKNDARTYLNLAAIYARTDRTDQARAELLRAHGLDPGNVAVLKNLAFLYRFYLDKPDSAMLWSNRFLNAEPRGDWDINVIRGEMLEMLERYPEHGPREPMEWRKPRAFARRGVSPGPTWERER